MQALLAKGADVNAKASDGTTALGAAAQGGHADIRALLAQAQATALTKRAEGFLKQMPEPDRVMADIHGSDSLDTAARQATALSRLADTVMLLSGQSQLTGEVKNLYIRYRDASVSVSLTAYKTLSASETFVPDAKQKFEVTSERIRWEFLRDGYYRDENSITALLKPYLTSDLLEIYLQLRQLPVIQ